MRLLRTYVVQFARAMLNKRDKEPQEADLTDCAKAENLWIVVSQSALIQDPKFNVWKRQFNRFLDQHGIWRYSVKLTCPTAYNTHHQDHRDQEVCDLSSLDVLHAGGLQGSHLLHLSLDRY